MLNEIWIPQQNIIDICKTFAEATGSEITDNTSYITFRSPGFFYTRNVLKEEIHEDVQTIIDSIKENSAKGGPTLTTFTKELMPEGTIESFKSNGFEYLLIQTGMVYETGAYKNAKIDPHVIRIGEDRISQWTDCMIEGFLEEGKKREDVIYNDMAKCPDFHILAYEDDGIIKGTLIIHILNGYAGLHEVAVPGRFRGQGIAKKLVSAALKIAEDNGCPGVTLQASDMGAPLYETFGFRKTGTNHTMFIK